MKPTRSRVPSVAAVLLAGALFACGGSVATEAPDPAEVSAGERLFRETRFAQAFAQRLAVGVNRPLVEGDPALDDTVTTGEPLPGPYAGLSMNCAACHLVDEQAGVQGGGIRTYTDFARRSPIPDRGDGKTTTPRNSPPLVGASIARDVSTFFHFDGEFATLEDLVRGTLTGRNYGWLPGEAAQAVAQIARVLREDDGSDGNAEDHGGTSYGVLLRAEGNVLPKELLIAPAFRVDVATATDEELFEAAVRLIAEYTRLLMFSADLVTGEANGSPYDRWLAKNGLPRAPGAGEAPIDYARRLRGLVLALSSPKGLDATDGKFAHHVQAFVFGPLEKRGLEIFLTEPATHPPAAGEIAAGGIGNCLSCHVPPAFTDSRFRNVGVAQAEFDGLHGDGAFAAIAIPTLAARSATPELFLPPSATYPNALGVFLAVPTALDPLATDLGLWNVFGNPAVPTPQAALRATLLEQLALPPATTDDDLLPHTISWFKTPTVRDLGQSGPYFHTGQMDAIEDVLAHYVRFSDLARAGSVRNAAPQLSDVAIVDADLAALAAFLRALNEDYE